MCIRDRVRIHEAFEIAFLPRQRFRKAAERAARRAHFRHALHPRIGNIGLGRGDHVVDHHADLVAHQLAQQPVARRARKAGFDEAEIVGDEGLRHQLVDRCLLYTSRCV